MRPYELGVVFRADLSEDELTTQIDTIRRWIETNGGQVLAIDHWGRRRLAYPIRRQRDGYYTFIKAQMPSSTPGEVERNLRLSENVLRYLLIREDE